MNMTMQRPLPYPVYMGTPRVSLPNRWSSVPLNMTSPRYEQFPSLYPIPRLLPPYVLPQQQNPFSKVVPPSSSYSNRRYKHLKQSTHYPNRRSIHPTYDPSNKLHQNYSYNEPIYTHQYRPSKTKSVSDFEQIPKFTSTPLPKAHSWHVMNQHRPSNLSVTYAKEIQLTPKRRRQHSPQKKKKRNFPRQLSSSPKRNPSFTKRRKPRVQIPECGIVRISTLDEMPIANNPKPKRNNSINNDRLSMKGSISNSSKRRIVSKERSIENNSIKNRKIKNKKETRVDSDTQSSVLSSPPPPPSSSSSSSSTHSYSSLQQRLNGSLRNDPLITAAMKDFRRHRRASSQNTLIATHGQNLSRDSLCSDSTFHSSSIYRSHSQSSFTSLERSEIRELIKTVKTKVRPSSHASIPSTSTPIPIPISIIPLPVSEQSTTTDTQVSTVTSKSKKSCIAEELDREFDKLRARDPEQELNYVTPSSICKRKKPIEIPAPNTPPLPKFDELLRQVQLRPVNKSAKPKSPVKEISTNKNYENPLSSVPVPRSSPIPSIHEIKVEEPKHEYATPIKKSEERSLPQVSYFQPGRNFNFTKPLTNKLSDKRSPRALSSFNWLQCGLTNQMPTTFQPNLITDNQNEPGKNSVKENIYTSEIDVCVPSSIEDKTDDNDDALQTQLDNQTIVTDDFYSDYGTKQTKLSPSILNDFSYLFTRKHKHEIKLHKKNQRCSIM